MDRGDDIEAIVRRLADAGFVDPVAAATELATRASGDRQMLDGMVERLLTGEPLAWITGRVVFCGREIRIDRGVYVPRAQTEPLALRAASRLPPHGVAIDVCTGSGAIAAMLAGAEPSARVVASDIDDRAVACAAANGVEVYCGDLFDPLPHMLEGSVDVIVGVVPYVPSAALVFLPRDTLTFESVCSYEGGRDGTDHLRRVLADGRRLLRRGGIVVLELGGGQADALAEDLDRLGYADVRTRRDAEGDVRGIEATFEPVEHRSPTTTGGVRSMGQAVGGNPGSRQPSTWEGSPRLPPSPSPVTKS